jgi:hypothetical protein
MVLSAIYARFMIMGYTYVYADSTCLYLKRGMPRGLMGRLLNSHRPQVSRLKPPQAKREVEVKAEVEQEDKKTG